MSSFRVNRIKKDLIEVLTNPLVDIKIYLHRDANLSTWLVELISRSGPLRDCSFYFEMTFPSTYPTQPPVIMALTHTPHICVDARTRIVCFEMTQAGVQGSAHIGWTPAYSAYSILCQMQDFFKNKFLSLNRDLIDRQVDLCRQGILHFKKNSLHLYEALEYRTMAVQVDYFQLPTQECTSDVEMKVIAQARLTSRPSEINIRSLSNIFSVLIPDEDDEADAEDGNAIANFATEDQAGNGDDGADQTGRDAEKVVSLPRYRVTKVLAAAVETTISQAKKLLKAGRVRVNGVSVNGGLMCEKDTISLDDEDLNLRRMAIVPRTGDGIDEEFSRDLWHSELMEAVPAHAEILPAGTRNFAMKADTNVARVDATRITATSQSNAGRLALPQPVLQYMFLMMDADDIGRVVSTCAYLRATASDGFFWQPLVHRYFPSCPLVPCGIVGSGSDWRRIWELEANGVHYTELRCFLSKNTFDEDVLGIPLEFTINPRTQKIDYICSTMDLLSHTAYAAGWRKSVWGEEAKAWLPLYFTQSHFDRSLPLLEKNLLRLATIVGPPSSQHGRGGGRGGGRSGGGRGGAHAPSISTVKFSPALILEVLPRLMNTMVVLLSDKGASHIEEALRGYCQIHRLFIALVEKYPKLKVEIRNRLSAFISHDSARSKSSCPNLGELLPLLSVCEEVGWLDIVGPLMEEAFSRNVLWVCRDVPEMAAIAKKSVTKITREMATAMSSADKNKDQTAQMLADIFTATQISRRLYSFHCSFLKMVAQPRGANLKKIAATYDRTLGTPPRYMRARMQESLTQIEGITDWPEYFDSVCLRRVSPEKLVQMWVQSVRSSLVQGYHTMTTSFERIQASGVSSILLRGKSYARVVMCLDVSGSMNCTSVDEKTGGYVSRLEYVKRDLQGIFANKLTHRNQFALIQFNHRVSLWRNGLQQATKENLDAATAYVKSWDADGGTDFDPMLDAAFGVSGVQAVYLLSDGEVYDEMDQLVEKARTLSKKGSIPCHTTAFFAPASGQELMRRIAEVTKGTYLCYGTSSY